MCFLLSLQGPWKVIALVCTLLGSKNRNLRDATGLGCLLLLLLPFPAQVETVLMGCTEPLFFQEEEGSLLFDTAKMSSVAILLGFRVAFDYLVGARKT